jgi:ribonuclease BN (tRNA processing enzyme)
MLIDDVLAVDAGALSSGLSLPEQENLVAVLLSHHHYDHIRDIPALSINFYGDRKTLNVYSTQDVYDALVNHLLNDIIYPNFMERPPEKPTVKFKTIEPDKPETIAGYEVLPVRVTHAVPTVGFQITSADGKKVFYTSDTGPGLAECWRKVTPELLIIEVTATNSFEDFAQQSGHLTPKLLQKELESFRELKGYLPRIVLVHMTPTQEKEIEAEISVVARNLDAEILLGYEGMQLEL